MGLAVMSDLIIKYVLHVQHCSFVFAPLAALHILCMPAELSVCNICLAAFEIYYALVVI